MDDDKRSMIMSRIWRTKGSRFNAYRRLKKRNNILTFVTSFSSVHLLAIGILQLTNLITLSNKQSELLSFISITLSIIILTYSLIENGKEHGLKSEMHHLCGIELDRIYTQLEMLEKEDVVEVTKLASNYNLVTEKYLLNHETIDDQFFQLQHLNDFTVMNSKSKFKKLRISFVYGYYDSAKAAFFVIIPLLISLYIVIYCF
jgi:hypothetical protein